MTSNVLGGIGAGIMQGAGIIHQKRQADSNDAYRKQVLANQQAQLDMQQETHALKVDEVKRVESERQRAETLGKLRLGIEGGYGDIPDYERESMFIDNGIKTGLIKPEELAAAKKSFDGMVKVAGAEAFNEAVLRQNVEPLQRVFKAKGLGDIRLDGSNFVITAGGKTSTVPRDGLLQMSVMSGAYERGIARQKAAAEEQKDRVDMEKTESETRKNDRMYGVVTNPDGTQSYMPRTGAGAGGKDGSGGGGEPEIPQIKISDIQHLAEGDPDRAFSIAATSNALLVGNPEFRKSPEQIYDIARRVSLPDDDPKKLHIEQIQDPGTGQWREGVRTPRGPLFMGANAIDPRRQDLMGATEQEKSALGEKIQVSDEDWLAAKVRTTPPEIIAAAGPYLNGQADVNELAQYNPADLQRIASSAAVSDEDRANARFALWAKSNPEFFKVASRVNEHARTGNARPGKFSLQEVPADIAARVDEKFKLRDRSAGEWGRTIRERATPVQERYGEAASAAQNALLLLRTNNKTFTPKQAMEAAKAIYDFPEIVEELKITDDELWAIKRFAGTK